MSARNTPTTVRPRAPRSAIGTLLMVTGMAGVLGAQGTPVSASAGRYPFTAADVQFVSGMIGHHTQAIVMARWAPSHGASQSIQTLCARIINAQTDEITLMRAWLTNYHQPVPDTG